MHYFHGFLSKQTRLPFEASTASFPWSGGKEAVPGRKGGAGNVRFPEGKSCGCREVFSGLQLYCNISFVSLLKL